MLACKIRVACGGLLYQKILQISKASAEDGQNGQMISLLSNDLTKFDFRFGFFTFLFEIPIEFLAYCVICYIEIGLSAVIGMAFLLAFTPLQGKIYKALDRKAYDGKRISEWQNSNTRTPLKK